MIRRTILIVDDSASVCGQLRRVLEDSGRAVLSASDGMEALEILRAEAVDLLITDLNMPNLDGISLIREVRKNPVTRFLPVIMLTVESEEAKRLEGKSAGASGWIVKPFRPEQLLAAVRMVLV